MARPTKEQTLSTIHADALADFDAIQTALRDERLQCLDDRRFYSIAGAQWEGPLGDQFENKPRFEFNDTHLAVIRIINEYRNNRITVNFQTKDGSKNNKLAETCGGLFRADEKACTAEEAYDNCFEEGTGGGFGAMQVRAIYEDEEDDEATEQRLIIEPVFDADSCVFYDLGAQRQDKSDAKRCYKLTPYPRAEYKEEWDDDPASWPKLIRRSQFDWATPDIVWVAELYKIEEVKQTIHFFRGLDENAEDMRVTDDELKADPTMLEQLQATGFREVRQKKITRKRVHKYIMSGGKILEDCGYIPGKCLPIVPFFGKRWVVDGVERCMGHVRLAKDAQRLKNMLLSWLAEMAARFDMEKPILTPEQIAGHATMWAEDNVSKFPYLLINPMVDPVTGQLVASGPIAYTKAPTVPPAMAALTQIAQQALQDLLGNQQAGEQLQPNLSGKAVELIQNRLDMQVFIYMSNFAKTIKRLGEVWLSMMKDIIVEEGRAMKVINENGETGTAVVNQPAYDEEGAEEYVENDLSKASFDVDVGVGPSSSSRRAATVRALTGMMQLTQDPEILQVLTSMALMNMEGEGLSEVQDYFRAKLLRMGAVKPTDEEKEQLAKEQAAAAQAPPSAQDQYLMAAAQKAAADASETHANIIETMASADLKRAQAVKTQAETAGEHVSQAISAADAMRQAAMPPDGMQGM